MDIITNVSVCVQSLFQLAFYRHCMHVVHLKKDMLSYFMLFFSISQCIERGIEYRCFIPVIIRQPQCRHKN